MKKLLICIISLLLVLGLASCSSKSTPYTIALDSNAGTGYEWTYTIDNSNIIKETSFNVQDLADQGVAGGPLKYEWTFEGLNDGTATITFILGRSWEDSYAKQVVYVVEVKNKQITEKSVTEEEIPFVEDNTGETSEEAVITIEDNTISLSGNPTTGYTWTPYYVNPDDESVLSISDYEYTSDNTEVLGAPGNFKYTITGLKEGKADIGFYYSQSFEKDSMLYDYQFIIEVDKDLNVTISRK